MSRQSWCAVLMLALVGSHAAARADGFDAQRFVPAAGAAGGLMVERPVVPLHLGFGAGLLLNYSYQPVILRDELTDQVVAAPLEHALSFDLLGSIGLFEWLEVALHLPLHAVYSSDNVQGRSLSASAGVGDLRLLAKVAYWLGGSPDLNFAVGFALPVTLPTGDEESLRGAGAVALAPQALFGMGASRWAVNASVGFRARLADQAPDLDGGRAFTYGVAGTFGLLTGSVPVDLQAELVGSVLTSAGVNDDAPLELLAGVIVAPHPQWSLYAAVGPGLTDGLGTPDVRFVFGVRFAHRVPGRDRYSDADNDQIPDYRDDCPTEPEDYDGFADDDGCPEPDNDGDGVPDERDECPTQAEEQGGDGDGCPDKGHVIIRRGKVYIFGKVRFETGSAKITQSSRPLLDQIAGALQEHPEIEHVTVVGHTDDVGNDRLNERLSRQRADAVKSALIERGVAQSRLSAEGRGESAPIAPNATAAGRAQNRRVEFIAKRR